MRSAFVYRKPNGEQTRRVDGNTLQAANYNSFTKNEWAVGIIFRGRFHQVLRKVTLKPLGACDSSLIAGETVSKRGVCRVVSGAL